MAWTVHKSELLFTEGVWSDAERELPICDKELLASTWGLVTLVPATGASNVMSFTDNTVAQAAMRTLTPTAEAMAHIVQRRSEWLLQWNILESVHVSCVYLRHPARPLASGPLGRTAAHASAYLALVRLRRARSS